MTDAHGKSRNWLKLGCFCVLGVGVLLAVWAASLLGTALTRARNEVVQSRELSREVSRPPEPFAVLLPHCLDGLLFHGAGL